MWQNKLLFLSALHFFDIFSFPYIPMIMGAGGEKLPKFTHLPSHKRSELSEQPERF